MSTTSDLYQEIILHHSRNPRHFGPLPHSTHQAKAENPLCGDSYQVYLQVDDDNRIKDATFEGAGCAISKASASLMTDAIIGKTVAEADALFEQFHNLVRGPEHNVNPETMGKLAAFSGVWKFPARVKCAILCWHAVHNALKDENQTSTRKTGKDVS